MPRIIKFIVQIKQVRRIQKVCARIIYLCKLNKVKVTYTAFKLNDYIVQNQPVEIHAFGKVARKKAYGVEFGIVENVRFQKYGRGNVKPFANIGKVVKKIAVSKLICTFVGKLFFYFSVFNNFRPNFKHITILLKTA